MENAPEPQEESPLLGRNGITPQIPKISRIDAKKFLGVFAAIGGVIVLFMYLKLHARQSAREEILPPEPPNPSEILKPHGQGLQGLLGMKDSYAGLDRRPVQALPVLAQPVDEPRFAALPPPVAQPAPPPPTPPREEPVRQRRESHAAPVAKKEPPKWLFAPPTMASSPFPKPEKDKPKAEEDKHSALLARADWVLPEDPTVVLYRNQTIHGQLIHDVNSDIPGQVQILVTAPVTDRFGQNRELIPQASVLLAEQAGRPEFGQNRLPMNVSQVIFPRGEILGFNAKVADQSGALGVEARVNNHWPQIAIGAFLSAALNIGARLPWGSSKNYNPTLQQEFLEQVGQGLSRPAQNIVDRTLNIPPTLTLCSARSEDGPCKKGTPVTIQLSDNISFARPPERIR